MKRSFLTTWYQSVFLRASHNRVMAFMLALIVAACQSTSTGLTAEQIRVLEQQGFTPVDDGWELNLSSRLLFDFDTDTLALDGQARIAEVTRALMDVGLFRVRLDGHTDATGDTDYNVALSHRRAASVASVMVLNGLAEQNIEINGLGSSRPVASNDTPDGRKENRRVSVVVVL